MASEPYTLTQAKADAIVELVSKGRRPVTAAALVDIPNTTWNLWHRQGVEALAETEDCVPAPGSLAELVQRIQTAEAQDIDRKLQGIDEAGQKPQHWAALGWGLERRYRDQYGRNELQAAQAPSVVVNIANVLPDGAAAALLAMAQAERAEGTKFLPTGEAEPEPSSPAPDSA